jgi:anti-sigma factor RsiW
VTDRRWRISVTTPDWGHGHLAPDAVVAYVDDELAPGPHLRATRHLAQCRECAAQVVAQGQARAALRTAGCPSMPSSLLSSLRSIPMEAELPGPPPGGLAVAPNGELMSVVRPDRVANAHDDAAEGHDRRGHRWLRFGTGVAASGLAVGAIAFGVPTDVSGPTVPATSNEPLPGAAARTAVAPIDAQFRIEPETAAPRARAAEPAPSDRTPVVVPSTEPALDQLDQLDRIPGSFLGRP